MRTSSLVLASGLMATAAALGEDSPGKADLDKLRGTWLTVSLINDGQTLMDEKTPTPKGPVTKLAYDGTRWTIKVGDKTVAGGVFQIDSTKTPTEIDILDQSGMKNDKTKLGIFALEGDTYKYCLAAAGKPRPTEFSSQPGSGNSLGMMRREQP